MKEISVLCVRRHAFLVPLGLEKSRLVVTAYLPKGLVRETEETLDGVGSKMKCHMSEQVTLVGSSSQGVVFKEESCD